MAFSKFSIDGTSLHQPRKWTVRADLPLHGPERIDIPLIEVPGRDGAIAAPVARTVGASTWKVKVRVVGAGIDALMANLAALEAVALPPRRTVTLKEEVFAPDGATITRTLTATAVCLNVEPGEVARFPTNCSLDVVLTFTVPAGVWLEPAASATIATTGNSTIAAFTGGSAPQTGQTITFTPTSTYSTVKVTQGNDGAAYTIFAGTVTSGTLVTLDLAAMTAKQGSTDLSGSLDIGEVPFYIPPAGTVYVSSMSNTASISITSRKAWY